ncbi:unnamed protein product [Strongylus vulgaris]|uniref:Uncharacterized protein n=1 Tax=Strongylus vulgaris TaxID=40348 RepID=A0A3P7LC56_STRVU|nr:unnamed protein product [Strongylus vulgaris]
MLVKEGTKRSRMDNRGGLASLPRPPGWPSALDVLIAEGSEGLNPPKKPTYVDVVMTTMTTCCDSQE